LTNTKTNVENISKLPVGIGVIVFQ